MLKAADPEYDTAEIEQLLAELEEQSTSLPLTPNSDSRFDTIRALHRSNDAAHANPQLHANIMHTEGSKGSPFLQAIDQEEEEEEEQGKACDTPDVAHAGTVFHENADASKSASFHMPLTSASKLSSTRECEMRRPVVVKLPLPPQSPPSFGCSCFSLSSYKSVQKKKKIPKGEFRSSKTKAKVQQASANCDDDTDNNNDDDEWQFISTEIGPREVDAGGLFDVKKTEREFKRVSLKEKQLTKEAKKLLDTIAST